MAKERSSRETPSRKPVPLQYNTRKSERLEKQTPSPPPSVTRKSERPEKQTPSPPPSVTRKSERPEKETPSPPPSVTRKSERLEKQTPSPPPSVTSRKSERLEKQTPSSPSVTSRKSERIKNNNAPSPLGRSDRGKSMSSLNSSGSRMSGKFSETSSDTDQRKHKKEKDVEDLTSQIRKCKPLMKARAYRGLFMRPPKRYEYIADQHGNKDNDMDQVDCDVSDRNSAKDMAETLAQSAHEDPPEQAVSPSSHSIQENNHVEKSSASPNADEVEVDVMSFTADGENDGAEKAGLECQQLENTEPQNPVVDLAGSFLKRKRNPAEVVPDVSAMVANGDGCLMSSEGMTPSTSECKNDENPETCNMCQKRKKVNHDSAKLACSCSTKLDQEFDCSVQDRGETEAASGKDIGEVNEQTNQQDELHDCKGDSSSYPEYWVPVQISNLQLEQYCATLLSNSLHLCSLSKNDPVRELHNTLNSVRKTCDHPYLVDESVRSLVIKNLKGIEILDVEIKASGKLQLLDTMLTEIRKKGLKAVVFFQGLTGDLLDLFMRQRFGESSYERIDRNVGASRKQCSMNKFNKKSERFVLLLETRACTNIIKLSSVEALILFASSWNPSQDLKFIQKIKIESQSERTKIFRLYSSCTVEEKALLLARQNKPVAENPSRLIIHELLMWGASYLFDKLDCFHRNQYTESGVLFEQSIIEGVIGEILSILSPGCGDKNKGKQCLILEAKHVQGTYSTDSTLFGEEKVKLSDEDSPNVFWTELLNQRSPTWRYCSVSSQRIRKRVSYFEGSETSAGGVNVGVAKKLKKAASDSSDHLAHHEEENSCGKYPKEVLESPRSASGTDDTYVNDALGLYSLGGIISEIPEDMLVGNEGTEGLCESQKSLHAALKTEMTTLCQVLHLSADVASVVMNFFEYVINNHRVCKEPTTTLQAFQIAVCWVAATLLNQKIKRKETLALAKDHLAYGCSREVVDYIYSMLCCLRSIFLKSQWGSRLDCLPKVSEEAVEGTSRNQVDKNMSQAMLLQEKNTEKVCGMDNQGCLSDRRSTDYGSIRKDIDKSIKDIGKRWSKQVKKLQAKHQKEKMELARNYEIEKSLLEKSKKAKTMVINIAWRAGSVQSKMDELKEMYHDFERKFDQLKGQMNESFKNLEEKHEAERKKLAEYEVDWIKRMERWAEDLLGLMDSKSEHHCGIIPSNTSGNASGVAGTCNDPAGDASGCDERPGAIDPLAKTQNMIGTTMADGSQLDVPEMVRNGQEVILPITSSQQHTHVVVTDSRSTRVMPPALDEDVTVRVMEISQPLENGVSDGENKMCTASAPILDRRNEETCSLNQESPGGLVLPLEHHVPAVESDGSAILDQAAHDMCRPPSLLTGTQHDPAPNIESQNIEKAAELSIAETDTWEVGAADPSVETDSQEMEAVIPSVAEPDTHEVEEAETSVPEPDTHEVEEAATSVPEPNTHEVEVAEFLRRASNKGVISGSAETSVPEPDTHEVEVAEFLRRASNKGVISGSAETSVPEPDTHEVEVAEFLRRASNKGVISGSAETSSNHAENLVELAQDGVVEPSAGDQPATSQGRSMTNHLPRSSSQATQQMPYAPHSDPFQYELEKIHKEAESATKIHEDTKSQLKAEFERKMAELRREYDIKYREADTKLQAKALELEAYKNLVVMNKCLADVFRVKCSDSNAASSTPASRDINSDMIHRLMQHSTQIQAQRSSADPSCPSVTSSSHSQLTFPPFPRPSVPSPCPAPPQSQSTLPPMLLVPRLLTRPPQSQFCVPPIPPVPRPSIPPSQSQSTVPPVPRPLVPPSQSQSTVPPVARPLVPPSLSQSTVPPVPRPSVPLSQSQSTVPPVPRPSVPLSQSQSTVSPVPRPSVPLSQSQSTVPPVPRPSVPLSRSQSTVPPAPSVHPSQSQSTVPPVRRSSIPTQRPFSMPQSRPPVITTTTPSSASPSPGSSIPPAFRGVRSPAPHLQSYRSSPPAVTSNVQRAPSPACQNSLPVRVPRPEAGEGLNTASNLSDSAVGQATASSAAAAATYSSTSIKRQQGQEKERGKSSGGDVVCLSDDE